MSYRIFEKRGALWADIRGRRPDGSKYRWRGSTTASNKRGAENWASQREGELIRQGGPQTPKAAVLSFCDYWPKFMQEHSVANREKPSSLQAKESIYKNHLGPAFDELTLDQISTAKVQELKAALASRKNKKGEAVERSPKTARNVLSTLSIALKSGVALGYIDRMPCTIRLPKIPKDEALEYYEPEIYEALVEAARDTDARFELLTLLGGDAGLRAGEIVALERNDIDYRRNVVRIERSEREGHVTAPKGGTRREVPMTARLAAALKANQHLRTPRVLWRDDGLNENKVEWALLVKWMARSQRKAGMAPTGRLHVLRHTFGARLATNGASPMAIKELMGHQSIQTTMRYMHLAEGAKDAAIRLLEAAPAGAPRKAPTGV